MTNPVLLSAIDVAVFVLTNIASPDDVSRSITAGFTMGISFILCYDRKLLF
jgi:hypothetical protein